MFLVKLHLDTFSIHGQLGPSKFSTRSYSIHFMLSFSGCIGKSIHMVLVPVQVVQPSFEEGVQHFETFFCCSALYGSC